MITGGIEEQSQSGSITSDEAAQGQSYADAIAQGMNNPSQNTGVEYAGLGAGGTAYAPAGTTVTLSNGITVTRDSNSQITATWQDGYSTGIAHPDGSYGIVFDKSGVYNADPITGERITIDPATGQETEIGPLSQLTAAATPWSYYHVNGDSITPVATIELDNPADVPITQQDVPTVAINGGSSDRPSLWTQANNYAAQIDPGVMALNWAADRAASQPLLSGALRTVAAVDEGMHRGVGNFVINTVGGLVNAVTHPVETVVGVVKAGVAALDYIGEAELGEVNPLSDAYNLATSSHDNAVNGFNQELTTQGSYAAIRDASAGGTEVALNVGSAFVPGLDAADAVRGVDIASDIGRADEVAEAAEVGGARKITEKGGCFVAGTLVHTRNGLVPIEQLRVGDFVLSQPENTGEQAYRRINETFVFEDKSIFQAVCQDEHGRSENILATPNHPFWVKGIGWTAAEYLEAGQVLELSDGRSAQVVSLQDTGETRQVFNFEVDGFHTYYVGKSGIWVHNRNCTEKQGGVYVLRDPNTGEVSYVGRTSDLATRKAQWARSPIKGKHIFETAYQTNSYFVQRGLEQMLYKHYSGVTKLLNSINPIRQGNILRPHYMSAARRFLRRLAERAE